MENNEIGNAVEAILNSFTAKSDAEANMFAANAINSMKENDYPIKTPEEFECFITYKVNNGLKAMAKTLHDVPDENIKNKGKADFIFINYSFLEHNIRELCTLREGSTCCADKSRHILKMYLDYTIHGTIPGFNPEEENYWVPNFGDNQMWIDLCDGLYELYYGRTERYFKAYNELIQCEIRKYKHILHRWFIEYTNGEIIGFTNTWDDSTDIPLKFNEDEKYYLILKRYTGTVETEQYIPENEEEKLYYKHCVKVNEDKILRIYCEDEEKMC